MKYNILLKLMKEIRNPLTLISGSASHLLESDRISEYHQKDVDRITVGVNRILKLIQRAELFEELEQGKLEVTLESVDIQELINTLINDYLILAKTKEIGINLNNLIYSKNKLVLDKPKIYAILEHLLDNALAYTNQGGTISIIVDETPDDKIRFVVQDSGVGIHPNQLDHLLDMSTSNRADKSEETKQGIGLFMIRGLVSFLNGTIEIRSQQGLGTTAIVELPKMVDEESDLRINDEFASNDSLLTANLDAWSHSQSQFRILIVEDQPEMRHFVVETLEKHFQVISAEDGQQAWEILTSGDSQIDLVVSDIIMPNSNGLELLSRIRKDVALVATPVIFLTALADEKDEIRALSAGVNDYITKPFSKEILLAHCKSILSNLTTRSVFLEGEDESSETFIQDQEPVEIKHFDLNWLEKAESLLIKNIGNSQFNVLWLADEMALSERQLRRKLKKITGLSPVSYFNEIKLRKARILLESGTYQTISQVSYAVGFDTPKYFSNLFLQRYGQRPSSYLS